MMRKKKRNNYSKEILLTKMDQALINPSIILSDPKPVQKNI
jgi:hypothetical protein